MVAISVIIPVYNVEAYIGKCANSLLNQSFSDAEYIFVNDASTDGSIGILKGIIANFPNRDVRIISHDFNKGLPSARRTGLQNARGRYVLNCDGDDWVETDMLQIMYDAAKENEADYVYCDYYLSYKDNERYMTNPRFDSADDMLIKGLLSGKAKYNVWNKLIRKDLYEGVEFPVNHKKGGEDMIMFDVLSKAKRVAYVPRALYHYVKYNENSISETFSEQRLIDIQYNANYAIQAVRRNREENLEKEIAFFKLNVKLPFLITNKTESHRIWQQWYPEANGFIWYNKEKAIRTRFLEWMASKGQWWYVKCYYTVVYSLLYQRIYRK